MQDSDSAVIDVRAKLVLDALMSHKGWNAKDVQRASQRPGCGHPERDVGYRTVYRVLETGHVPQRPLRFEIAAVFGLTPNHIWGNAPLPGDYAYINDMLAMVA